MVAFTAEKSTVLAAVQANHGAELVALCAVRATHRENKILPCLLALWMFHVG
jgi:hypothetical protein